MSDWRPVVTRITSRQWSGRAGAVGCVSVPGSGVSLRPPVAEKKVSRVSVSQCWLRHRSRQTPWLWLCDTTQLFRSPDLCRADWLTDWLTQTGCCLKYFQSGREWQGEWEIILSTGRSDGGELGDCQDLHNIWEFLRFQFAILHDIELGGTQDELITSNYQLCCSHFYLLSFSASITAEL